MRFDLAAMVRRAGKLRRSRALPIITPTKAQADELARIYMRMVRSWSTYCRGPIIRAYERSLEQAARMRDSVEVRDDSVQISSQVGRAGDTLLQLILELTPELRDWVFRIERWHRSRWIANTFAATAVDLMTQIGAADVRETIEGVILRNTSLIRDVSEQARGRIADIVLRGLQARTPARQVAKEMAEAVSMARARALRIASDQLTKLSAELDAERQRQSGINEWIWRHSGKLHPRLDHQKRDGNHYTDETAPTDLPGQLPFCGCRRQAYLALD